MATGNPRSPKLLKGALIEFSERLIGPVPNIIVFQYNPESMTRTLEVWNAGSGGTTSGTGTTGSADISSTAQPIDPPETFSLVLAKALIEKSTMDKGIKLAVEAKADDANPTSLMVSKISAAK